MFHSKIRNRFSTKNVCFYAFRCIIFHQRHMLVRRGMEMAMMGQSQPMDLNEYIVRPLLSNISVIAWHPRLWDTLVAQVTEAAVARQFAHREPSRVTRYLLPNLHGMNFVLLNVLEGGVNESLNLDMHGKALSFLLLSLPVKEAL